MDNISIIYAGDGSEWGQFLAKEIQELGKVVQYTVDGKYLLPWTEMDQDVSCIIFSPDMLESNKDFIQKSGIYLKNPIIVLCGVPQRVISQAVCCKPWRKCQALTVTSSTESADNFYRAVEKRLLGQNSATAITLIPDTIVQKANQSCVLMFSRPVLGEVEVLITGCTRKLIAKQKDIQTYVFNISELAEGNYKLGIFVSNQLIPAKLSLTVTSPKPSKCLCDYIFQILGSEDFHPLDKALTTSMESDYSNRLFYQNILKPNPDFPEFPTALHFAAEHGMHNVLQHLLRLPNAKRGLTIKNDKRMDCLDIAKSSKYSTTLVPFLKAESDENLYIDMTQNHASRKIEHLRRNSNHV